VRRLASELHMSPRHLRRVVRAAFDVTPMELLTTRRLLLAKQLLVEPSLPVTDVAFASGFRSLRRFNDAFLASYGMPPTRFRRPPERGVDSGASGEPTLSLRLDY